MIKNYSGYPTYQRDLIKWKFDPEEEKKKTIYNIINTFKQ